MYSYLKPLRYLMMCLSEDLVSLLGIWQIEVGGGCCAILFFSLYILFYLLFSQLISRHRHLFSCPAIFLFSCRLSYFFDLVFLA